MAKQNLSAADQLYVGSGYDAGVFGTNQRKGVPIQLPTRVALGSPVAIVTDALIKAATSTELPNASTKTYTPGTVTSPLDSASLPAATTLQTSSGSVSVWPLDVPRAITSTVTHGSAVVASTITITGYDVHKAKMVETHTITAGTTSKSVAGKKAFAYISSIAITSASDSTANTANIGWNDVLGLPYKLAAKSDLIGVWFNDTLDASATVVLAVTTDPATASTGDVRGTVDTASASDGSSVVVRYYVTDNCSAVGLRGVTQYAG